MSSLSEEVVSEFTDFKQAISLAVSYLTLRGVDPSKEASMYGAFAETAVQLGSRALVNYLNANGITKVGDMEDPQVKVIMGSFFAAAFKSVTGLSQYRSSMYQAWLESLAISTTSRAMESYSESLKSLY